MQVEVQVLKDLGVNLLVRKKKFVYNLKHKTYHEKYQKLIIRKKENSMAEPGLSILVINCRKFSPRVYYKEVWLKKT